MCYFSNFVFNNLQFLEVRFGKLLVSRETQITGSEIAVQCNSNIFEHDDCDVRKRDFNGH